MAIIDPFAQQEPAAPSDIKQEEAKPYYSEERTAERRKPLGEEDFKKTAEGLRLERNVLSFMDMVLGTPSFMAATAIKDVIAPIMQVRGALSDIKEGQFPQGRSKASWQTAQAIGEKFSEITTPSVRKLLEKLGLDKTPAPSEVDSWFKKFDEFTHGGAEKIEKATGIPAEEVDALRDSLLSAIPYYTGMAYPELKAKLKTAVDGGGTPAEIAKVVMQKAKDEGLPVPKEFTEEAVAHAVQKHLEPVPGSPEDMLAKQQQTKSILATMATKGEITPEHSFRSASPAELEYIAHNKAMSASAFDAEGNPSISAATLEHGVTVRGMGDGFIVPPEATIPSGRAAESLIDPATDPTQLKYIYKGKVLSFDELQKQFPKKAATRTELSDLEELQRLNATSSKDLIEIAKQKQAATQMEALDRQLEKPTSKTKQLMATLDEMDKDHVSYEEAKRILAKGQAFKQRGSIGFSGAEARDALRPMTDLKGLDAAAPGGDVRPEGERAPLVPGWKKQQLGQLYPQGFTKGAPDYFKKQMGAADKALIIKSGLMLGGATLGASLYPNDTTAGLIGGAVFGFGLASLPKATKALSKNWTGGLKTAATGAAYAATGAMVYKDNPLEGLLVGSAIFGLRFLPKAKAHEEDVLANAYFANQRAEARLHEQIFRNMDELIPDMGQQKELKLLMEKPSFTGRNAEETAFVDTHRGLMKSFENTAKDINYQMGVIESYVAHIVDSQGLPQSKVKEIMMELYGSKPQTGVGGTRFTKERKFATFADLEKALEGTQLKVADLTVTQTDRIYAKAMNRAFERHKLIDALKKFPDAQGNNAEFITTEQRFGYTSGVGISPQLAGHYVNPEIAPMLKFVFDARHHDDIVNGMMALNRATKRMNVVGSLFHAKSLLEGYMLAGGNPFTMKRDFSQALQQWREAGLGSELDKGIRSGLVVGDEATPIEVSKGALEQIGQLADHLTNKMFGSEFEGVSKVGRGIEQAQAKIFDKVTWDYLHPAVKIATYLRLMEEYHNRVAEVAKMKRDGTYKPPRFKKEIADIPEDVYRRGVTSHVNKTFGGLDWYQLVSESKTKAGRQLAMTMFKPSARDWLGMGLFAPDWTTATLKAFADALPGGSKNPANAMLARRYALRTAVVYGVVLNTINNYQSGHNMWDNKDPVRLDNGDGTSTQLMKHATEGPEWVLNPRKTFGNKLALPLSTGMALLYKQQYPGGPPITSPFGEVAGRVLPFTARGFQGDLDQSEQARRSILLMFGIGLYGMTPQQKEEARLKRKEKKIKDPFK